MSNETLKYQKNILSKFRMDHYSDYPKINECYISGSNSLMEGSVFYGSEVESQVEPSGPSVAIKMHEEINDKAIASIRTLFDPKIKRAPELWGAPNSLKHLDILQVQRGRGACKYLMHLVQPNELENEYLFSKEPAQFSRDTIRAVALVGSTATYTVIADYLTSNPLEDLIIKSNRILNLETDWDQEGALQIDQEIYAASIDFLRAYYNHIKATSYSIQLPEINPCPDGTVDLEWHTDNAQLLINFRRDKEGAITAFYYGDQFSNKEPIKGSVAAIGVKEHLAAWMKYLA